LLGISKRSINLFETVTEKSDVEEGDNLNETDPSGNTAVKHGCPQGVAKRAVAPL